MHALPVAARRVRAAPISPGLPVIDLVAERTWGPPSAEVAALRREPASFGVASPARETIFASGSGHYVMRGHPELVLEAVARMVDRARAVH